MKMKKRIAAIFTTAALALTTLILPAFTASGADPTGGTIKINNPKGHTYKFYRIITGDFDSQGKIMSQSADFDNAVLKDLTELTADDGTYKTLKSGKHIIDSSNTTWSAFLMDNIRNLYIQCGGMTNSNTYNQNFNHASENTGLWDNSSSSGGTKISAERLVNLLTNDPAITNNYLYKDGAALNALGNAFLTGVNDTPTKTVTASGNDTIVAENLPAGYYLIAYDNAPAYNGTAKQYSSGDLLLASTMFAAVCDANIGDDAVEIDAKNDSSVPKVGIEVYKNFVTKTTLTDDNKEKYGINQSSGANRNGVYSIASDLTANVIKVNETDTSCGALPDDDFKQYTSLGLTHDDQYLLYRVSVTLPDNFESYNHYNLEVAVQYLFDNSL